MGHANLSNLSEAFIRQIYAHGKITIRQCVAFAVKHKIPLCASEGHYEDEPMLSDGFEHVVHFHCGGKGYVPGSCEKHPQVEPITDEMTLDQKEIWQAFLDGTLWDNPKFKAAYEQAIEDGGCCGILDDIPLRFTKGTRKKYLEGAIHHLGNVET